MTRVLLLGTHTRESIKPRLHYTETQVQPRLVVTQIEGSCENELREDMGSLLNVCAFHYILDIKNLKSNAEQELYNNAQCMQGVFLQPM